MNDVITSDLDSVIRAVRAGDRERYGEVVTLLEARVRVVLSLMLPDRSVVQDLAHEVFVVAYLKLAEYREGTDFAAWVKAIARNLAYNERRRWIREKKFTSRFAVAIEDDLIGSAIDVLVEKAEEGEKAEISVALRDCVAALSASARETIERFYFDDASVADIATNSGRTTGAIKVMLFRARAALAMCLAAKGVRL